MLSQVQAYQSVAEHVLGSDELAYQFFGLQSTDGVVIIMLACTFTHLFIFAFAIFAGKYSLHHQEVLESRWSLCAINPPEVKKWKLSSHYACFISHYKMGKLRPLFGQGENEASRPHANLPNHLTATATECAHYSRHSHAHRPST